MRIGVFISETWRHSSDLDEVRQRARQAEALGFSSAWVPYVMRSLDALLSIQAAGAVTKSMELGSAVIPTYLFHPLALARQAHTLRGELGGRLTLGIGCSQQVVIEKMHGLPFTRPAQHVREYVEILRRTTEQSGHVEYDGELFQLDSPFLTPGAGPLSVLLGAIGPLMLQVAGELTDGTIATMSDEGAIERVIVPAINSAANTAGRPAPRVGAVIPIIVTDDLEGAQQAAGDYFIMYEGLPRYKRMIELGNHDRAAGLCIIGNERAVQHRMQRFADAGLTDFIAAPFTFGDQTEIQRQRTLECLADF